MTTLTRRSFLRNTGIAAGGFWIGTQGAWGRGKSPNEKLNIGVIGTANRAHADIEGVASQNIVAACDIDDLLLAKFAESYPDAKQYVDFRKLIEQKDVEAVVVGTADHTHAAAAIAALKAGKHVYCEKPLAHSVYEVRAIRDTAAKNSNLATQMGTQIHAGTNYRRVVELVQSGAIGAVKECHVWCDRSWTAPGRPTDTPPVPSNLHWDLWLGPAPKRPYSPEYLPKNWRRWWDFGSGTLGDMACHYMDLAFWALKLRAPLTVEAEGPPVSKETTPAWLIVHYEYEAREKLPPVKVTWYDGGKQPDLVKDGKALTWPNAVLFVGEKGMLQADYQKHRLLPEKDFAGFQPPSPFIPNSIGHHNEWIQACKTGSPTTCNFDYSGALSEAVLLGNVAYRAGKKIEWDSTGLRAKNARDAMKYVHPELRKGWGV